VIDVSLYTCTLRAVPSAFDRITDLRLLRPKGSHVGHPPRFFWAPSFDICAASSTALPDRIHDDSGLLPVLPGPFPGAHETLLCDLRIFGFFGSISFTLISVLFSLSFLNSDLQQPIGVGHCSVLVEMDQGPIHRAFFRGSLRLSRLTFSPCSKWRPLLPCPCPQKVSVSSPGGDSSDAVALSSTERRGFLLLKKSFFSFRRSQRF